MHLTGIKLGGIPPFTDPITLKFDERVNVFIGPNATGKSTMLRELTFKDYYYDHVYDGTLNPTWEEVPHIYLPPTRIHCDVESASRKDPWSDKVDTKFRIPEGPAFGPVFTDRNAEDWHFVLSATDAFLGAEFREVIEFIESEGGPDSNCNKEIASWMRSVNILDWFRWQCLLGNYRGNFDGDRAYLAMQRLYADDIGKSYPMVGEVSKIAYACAKGICPEVLTGPRPFSRVINSDPIDSSEEIPIPKLEFGSLVSTPDSPLESPIHLSLLSTGTQGLYLWIWFLACRIGFHYQFKGGWHEKPAILLIDEIENHLHPTWQRRVIPALLEHFPGLQIFATTHSPFVVAGLKAGQVHVLKRDENGVVTASTEQRDVIGWTADEILRGMMGVDEPTDQLTVDRANRLRELRKKDSLTEVEEEELNRLRRQVNSDLLSKGGLLESQKERYADLVQDFLRIRQNELTQDGE